MAFIAIHHFLLVLTQYFTSFYVIPTGKFKP